MKVHVWIILLFFSSIAYAEENIRWKDADEKMQEQQYEEAAKLYKELSHKSDYCHCHRLRCIFKKTT